MGKTRLTDLEKKYWEGKTSLEEEDALRNAVNSDSSDISTSLISVFKATSESHEASLDDDFDALFWQKAETISNRPHARIFTLSQFMRYAAIGIILLGISGVIWTLVLNDKPKEEVAQNDFVQLDTYDDPELAFEETKRVLMYASQKLNEGKKPLGEIKRFYNAKMSIAGEQADSDTARTNNSAK